MRNDNQVEQIVRESRVKNLINEVTNKLIYLEEQIDDLTVILKYVTQIPKPTSEKMPTKGLDEKDTPFIIQVPILNDLSEHIDIIENSISKVKYLIENVEV